MPATENGFRYPASGAAPNVSQDIQNLASDVDTKLAINVPTDVTTMAARPTTGLAAGKRIRALNRPTVVYVYDGTRWVQDGLLADVSGAPAGSYVSRQEGTKVAATTNTSGAFLVPLDFAYTVAPLWVSVSAGDNASGLVDVGILGSQNSSTYISCQGYTANGSFIGNGVNVRVTYTAVGYNT